MSAANLLSRLSGDDYAYVSELLGGAAYMREPDLTIAPDGTPYIFRWYLVPRTKRGNVYLHVQVQSDPERPLHDHPWDNQSVIISGGYDELYVPYGVPSDYDGRREPTIRQVRAGRVVHRKAEEAHRLILPADIPYTISLFSTGPVIRQWGFWLDKGWRSADDCLVQSPEGYSVFMEPADV